MENESITIKKEVEKVGVLERILGKMRNIVRDKDPLSTTNIARFYTWYLRYNLEVARRIASAKPLTSEQLEYYKNKNNQLVRDYEAKWNL